MGVVHLTSTPTPGFTWQEAGGVWPANLDRVNCQSLQMRSFITKDHHHSHVLLDVLVRSIKSLQFSSSAEHFGGWVPARSVIRGTKPGDHGMSALV